MFYICFALLSRMLACPLYIVHNMLLMLIGIHLENWNCSVETRQTAQYLWYWVCVICIPWWRASVSLFWLFCFPFFLFFRHHPFPKRNRFNDNSFTSLFFGLLLILRPLDNYIGRIRWQAFCTKYELYMRQRHCSASGMEPIHTTTIIKINTKTKHM